MFWWALHNLTLFELRCPCGIADFMCQPASQPASQLSVLMKTLSISSSYDALIFNMLLEDSLNKQAS